MPCATTSLSRVICSTLFALSAEPLDVLFGVASCTLTVHLLRLQALGKRTKFVRDLVREVAGFAPYERRVVELLRIGADKRALKFSKKRVREGDEGMEIDRWHATACAPFVCVWAMTCCLWPTVWWRRPVAFCGMCDDMILCIVWNRMCD